MRGWPLFRQWLAQRDAVERSYSRVAGVVLGISVLHGARGFWFLIPIDPLGGLVYLGVGVVALVYLCRGIYWVMVCAHSDRPHLKSRACCVWGLAACMAIFPLAHPYFQGARLRFWLQGGEEAYLRFAADARAKSPAKLPPPPKETSYEYWVARKETELRRAKEFRSSLGTDLLDHHPTSWRRVGVDSKSVSLWSGSGLTGSWGIEICDQPELPRRYKEAETNENPYLPSYQPMSERVWLWTSD